MSDPEVRVEVDGRVLSLSNLDKVLYPASGTTKGEVLHYYATIAPYLLPQLADRAVTRIRWPHGVEQQSFFEKNAPAGTPSWVRTAEVSTTGSRSGQPGTLRFPIVDSVATLTWLANLAALELHVHQWRVDDRGESLGADRLVIDLDPGEGAGLDECCAVALLVREALGERGLACHAVTSGSKGMHLYAPLPQPLDPDAASATAKQLAEELQRAHPKQLTATMTKTARRNKVFLDWSQNAGSKTTLVPYSLRGTPRPQVATPLAWDEVEIGAVEGDLEQFGMDEAMARIAEVGDLGAAITSA